MVELTYNYIASKPNKRLGMRHAVNVLISLVEKWKSTFTH